MEPIQLYLQSAHTATKNDDGLRYYLTSAKRCIPKNQLQPREEKHQYNCYVNKFGNAWHRGFLCAGAAFGICAAQPGWFGFHSISLHPNVRCLCEMGEDAYKIPHSMAKYSRMRANCRDFFAHSLCIDVSSAKYRQNEWQNYYHWHKVIPTAFSPFRSSLFHWRQCLSLPVHSVTSARLFWNFFDLYATPYSKHCRISHPIVCM